MNALERDEWVDWAGVGFACAFLLTLFTNSVWPLVGWALGTFFWRVERRGSSKVTTLSDLQQAFPEAAVESSCSGEVVIYTGLAINDADPEGPLVTWCDNCESGNDLPEDHSCPVCGRSGVADKRPTP